jgi:phosphatidylserine/phosphatidylglycerophosphate/cardiolipin synthase-like enzyme
MARRGTNWLVVLTVMILAALAAYLQQQHRRAAYRIEHAAPGEIISENHLSPSEDLEQIDLDRLDGAKHSIDIAMYAVTDRALADELVKLAQRGVAIRVYRDGEQFEDEQRNAREHRDSAAGEAFRGVAGIQVRVKPASRRDLMHLKAYAIDGLVLRDGSANWSLAGEKIQDNNARFTNDPAEIRAFEADFEAMWSRTGNTVVQ